MTETPLAPSDIGHWLGSGVSIDGNRADTAIRMAAGWLIDATRIDPWPMSPLPQDLWAWWLELAALAYKNNPGQMTQRQVGGIVTMWAPDAQARRREILDAARSRYNTSAMPATTSLPVDPRCAWPDPAFPFGVGGLYYR